MKKIIIGVIIFGTLVSVSVPQKAHASILWYLIGNSMGNSSGQSTGRALQKTEDQQTITDLNAKIVSLQKDLNSCQIKIPKKPTISNSRPIELNTSIPTPIPITIPTYPQSNSVAQLPQKVDNIPMTTNSAPKEVSFNAPFAWCGVQPRVDYVSFYCNGIQVGDKFTLTVAELTPIEKVVDVISGKDGYSLGLENGTLTPDTLYTFNLKIERGNEFAIIKNNFKTLSK